MKHIIKIIPVALVVFLASCKQDYVNPNASTETDVYGSIRGLNGVATGLQRVYSDGRQSPLYNTITCAGALCNEFRLMNTGNVDEAALFAGGGSVDATNGIVNNLWIYDNKIIYEADKLIAAANGLGDKNYASGLIAYASIFKAMAIGTMATFWENVPSAPGTTTSPSAFQTRIAAYTRAVQVLTAAQTAIAANPISASFAGNVPTGIDIPNALNALKARYSLFAGDYTGALAAAGAVSLSSKSELKFDAINTNPVFTVCTATNNVYQVLDSTLGLLGSLQPDLADKRVLFHSSINAAVAPRYRINGFYAANTTGVPVYLPGEMTLIKAECYLRQASPNTVAAKTELDAILTKTPAADAWGVGAQLPAYAGSTTVADLLDQVYRNRCIELYMTGLKLEDNRRFGRAVAERKRSFFPYPFRERDNNPNTPANPAF
jgi:starch-binding outer membrane protein, SusD/RagB family